MVEERFLNKEDLKIIVVTGERNSRERKIKELGLRFVGKVP